MSKINSQKGRAFIVGVIILAVLVLGGVGYVAWKSFYVPKTLQVTHEVINDDSNKLAPKEKTFTSDKYGITFTYPSDWTVKEIFADDQQGYVRSYSVQKTEDDSLTLSVGNQGIGGTCDYSAVRSNNVIEAESVGVKSQKPATVSYIVYQDAEGYTGAYGLTDYYTEVRDSPSCPNVFYMFIPATNTNLHLIGFGGSKKFASFEEARQFKDSDTYKTYKKIISSLNYID